MLVPDGAHLLQRRQKMGKGAPYGIYPVTFGPLHSDDGSGKLSP